MLSYSRPVERCRPLLGTFVRIRVHELAPERARAAIEAAFAEVASVHRLMSFHEGESDVSRLNRDGAARVDGRTYAVLECAGEIASASRGLFDVTVAPALVASGALPRPDAPEPDPAASWRDVKLLGDRRVKFARPLWIDLSGIAKGYAVDRAMSAILRYRPAQACVNAGGDLRIAGAAGEAVLLRPGAAAIEVEDGSVAASRRAAGVHIDPHGGEIEQRFVAVTAPLCMHADALTKVAMIAGGDCAPVLARYGAQALIYCAIAGWQTIGGG